MAYQDVTTADTPNSGRTKWNANDSELYNLVGGKANSSHTHGISDLPVAASGASSTTQLPRADDARLSDTRTPTDGTVTDIKVSATAAIAESKLNLATDAAPGTASRRSLGTGAQQAAAGNDPRLSDKRVPTFIQLPPHHMAGTLSALTGKGKVPIMSGGSLTEIRAQIGTAPTGGPLTINVLRNGTQVATLDIAAGAVAGIVTGLSVVLAAGDYLTVNLVAGAGNTAMGADLTVAYLETL